MYVPDQRGHSCHEQSIETTRIELVEDADGISHGPASRWQQRPIAQHGAGLDDTALLYNGGACFVNGSAMVPILPVLPMLPMHRMA